MSIPIAAIGEMLYVGGPVGSRLNDGMSDIYTLQGIGNYVYRL